MAKIRIHEIAKELNVESKEVVSFLQEKGFDVKAQSSIEDDAVDLVKKKFGKTSEPKKEELKPEEKPVENQ